MIYAHYLSSLYWAIYKDFSKGFPIRTNSRIQLHLYNIFMELNLRWKYLRQRNAMQLYCFPYLSFSASHSIMPQRYTDLVAVSWSTSTGNRVKFCNTDTCCAYCQSLLYLYCVVTASQRNCTFTYHVTNKIMRSEFKIHSVHSEGRQYLLPQVSWQELTDQTAKSTLSSALGEFVAFASAVMH